MKFKNYAICSSLATIVCGYEGLANNKKVSELGLGVDGWPVAKLGS